MKLAAPVSNLAPLEVAGARHAFSVAVSSCEVDAYWSGSCRSLHFRSAQERERKQHKLPADAQHVGRFTKGCPPIVFVEELDGFLGLLKKAAA